MNLNFKFALLELAGRLKAYDCGFGWRLCVPALSASLCVCALPASSNGFVWMFVAVPVGLHRGRLLLLLANNDDYCSPAISAAAACCPVGFASVPC